MYYYYAYYIIKYAIGAIQATGIPWPWHVCGNNTIEQMVP